MSSREYLGEFELVVLSALARLGDGAYGASIHREILDATGRDVSVPSVYVTLKRMERKGLVESELGRSEKGAGRPTRNYQITHAGDLAIARSREQLERLWTDLNRSLPENTR